jgi:hypothetical protein
VFAKPNPSSTLKENLEVEEYLSLLETPCLNEEVKAAFIFCCYNGLRWVDVIRLSIMILRKKYLLPELFKPKQGNLLL